MASLTSCNGYKAVQFVNSRGERKTVAIGKLTKAQAQEVKGNIERLNAAAIAGTAIDDKTAAWLAGIGDSLHTKLAAVQLVQPRATAQQSSAPALGVFVDAFIAGRNDWKPNTRISFIQTRKALVKHFGEDRRIDAITAGDADEWAAALRSNYSPATIATFIKRARQMFRHAARKRLLPESPFAT